MGQRISVEQCYASFGVRSVCEFNSTYSGEHKKGDVPTEPDIAGVGVVYSFIAVTAFAAVMSLCMLAWNAFLAIKAHRSRRDVKDVLRGTSVTGIDFAAICDKLITACSDQQIVVGSAYLWGVHNGTGCTTSFYHIIVVSNMIVLSCATHLLCIVSARHYYRNPVIAMVRIVLIFVIIGYAGKLMSGGYSEGAIRLPTTRIPESGPEQAVFFLPSPCFMKRSNNLRLKSQWPEEVDLPQWKDDDVSSKYMGWEMYIMVVSLTGFAVFVTWMKELFRTPPLDSKKEPWGLRKFVHRRHDIRGFMSKHARWFTIATWAYRTLGVLCATGAIVTASHAVVWFRAWAQRSGWLEVDDDSKKSPEANINDLGQLLAAFSCALIFFVLLQELFDELNVWRKRRAALRQDQKSKYQEMGERNSLEGGEQAITQEHDRFADQESQLLRAGRRGHTL